MELWLLLALAGVLYVGACAWWPYTRHRWCGGTGRFTSPGGKAWRTCRGCQGNGRKVRLGRRIYEAVRDLGAD